MYFYVEENTILLPIFKEVHSMMIRNFNKQIQQERRTHKNKGDYLAPITNDRFFTLFLKYVSAQNNNKRIILKNFQVFISKLPLEKYEKKFNVYALAIAIGLVIKSRLEGVNDKEELIEMIDMNMPETFDEVKDNIIYPTILSGDEITDKENDIVTKMISIYMRYGAILSQQEKFADVFSDIGSGNFKNLEAALEEFKEAVYELYDEFRKTEYSTDKYIITHTSDTEDFAEKLKNAYNYATSPKIALKTGLKTLNTMLSVQGGFTSNHFYMIYSDTNSFKSALLKYIAKWIQKYNNDMFREEYLKTGKRPTVLYISLEDGEIEDINRMFTTVTAKDLINCNNFIEAEKIWTANFKPEENIIDICQINSTENSINLSTIEGFIKNLEENNYFIIALIIDSFDLMAPSEEDIFRGITDETTILSNRAKAIQKYVGDKLFPVITAHQLNRSGNQIITEKKDKGIVDIAKALGRSMISGAYDIERRVHWSAFIYVEYSKYDGEMYLEIKRDKVKYKRTNVDYMVHHLKNGFIIEDDYYLDKVLSRGSIIPVDNDNMYSQGAQSLGLRGVSSISRMNDELISASQKKHEETKTAAPLFQSSTVSASSSAPVIPFPAPSFIQYGESGYYSPIKSYEGQGITPFNLDDKPAKFTTPFDFI
jgi:hypothetical protein